jgi:hypothetical protein
MVLVPFFVPLLAVFVKIIDSSFSTLKYKNLALAAFFCVILSEELVKYLDDALEIFHNNSYKELIAAGAVIDENTASDDRIISLGINGYIYPFSARRAASKYIYQGSGIDHLPRGREEFLSDVLNNKPAIIAIFTAEDNGRGDYLPAWYAPVYDLIARDYKLLSDENGYTLFKKRPPPGH